MNEVQIRFWSKVKKTDHCWEWLAYRDKDGYGTFWMNGRDRRAHRVSFEFVHGTISPNRIICHSCDNPGCVNPNHLFSGTTKDNVADKIKKGRYRCSFGSNHGNAKLSEEDVKEIRKTYRSGGITFSSIAKRYRVSRHCVTAVIKNQTWTHV